MIIISPTTKSKMDRTNSYYKFFPSTPKMYINGVENNKEVKKKDYRIHVPQNNKINAGNFNRHNKNSIERGKKVDYGEIILIFRPKK